MTTSATAHSKPAVAPDATPTRLDLPRMARVRQQFPVSPPVHLEGFLTAQLPALFGGLKPDAEVAVAVGSRGIARLERMVRTVVTILKRAGARPFILPAMGSHGGATPEGQAALLAGYGITEANLGVPIRASMEAASVGFTPEGLPVVCSTEALRADAVLLLNRIKPHTDFSADIGSGLLKMLVVGLGKRTGAANFHRAAGRLGPERVLRTCAAVLRQRLPLLGGVAILEDQRHETASLEIVPPDALETREAELCARARRLMPRLPLDDIDLLVVDWMGKNLSGTGMDPALIGRSIHGYSLSEEVPQPTPRIRRLFVRDLTPESRGNAIGLGMADFTTTRLVQAMDREVTTMNALTALSLQGAKVPIHFETDEQAIRAALDTLGLADPHAARVVRIRDTLSVEDLEVSEACRPALEGRPDIAWLGSPAPMEFDPNGNLPPMGR